MNAIILDKARELGRLLRDSDIYKAMQSAEDALSRESVFDSLMTEYAAAREAMQNAAQSGDNVAAAAGELERIQDQIDALPAMARYREAHAAFQGALRRVNAAMEEAITGRPAHACSGHCEGCGGCA